MLKAVFTLIALCATAFGAQAQTATSAQAASSVQPALPVCETREDIALQCALESGILIGKKQLPQDTDVIKRCGCSTYGSILYRDCTSNKRIGVAYGTSTQRKASQLEGRWGTECQLPAVKN